MKQHGTKEQAIHATLGKKMAESMDVVIVIGKNGIYGDSENIHYASGIPDALKQCTLLADENTILLCKGSQGTGVEAVVKGLVRIENE